MLGVISFDVASNKLPSSHGAPLPKSPRAHQNPPLPSDDRNYLNWYARASISHENLGEKWHQLKQHDGFTEFSTWLEQLNDPNIKYKLEAKEVVKIIRSVTHYPMMRELIFKEMKRQNGDTVLNKYNQARGYAHFAEQCAYWYKKIDKSPEDFPQHWNHAEKESDFNEFATLLQRLSGPRLKDKVIATSVIEVIEAFIECPSSRKLMLNATIGAAQDCTNRPLYMFNRAQEIALFGKRENENVSSRILFLLVKKLLRSTLLEDAAFEVTQQQKRDGRLKVDMNEEDELDCYLVLSYQLKNDLDLPFATKPLHIGHDIKHGKVAELTDADKTLAKDYVHLHMRNQTTLVNNLVRHPVWKSYLERRYADEIATVTGNFQTLQDQNDDVFQKAQDQYDKKIIDLNTFTEMQNMHVEKSDKLLSDLKSDLERILKSKTRSICIESERCTLV